MLHFQSYGRGRFHVAQTNPEDKDFKQVVLVCNAAPLNVFFELKQMFFNFVDFLRAQEKIKINLHIVAPPAGLNAVDLREYVAEYLTDEGIEGVVIANYDLAAHIGGDGVYRYLNYLIHPDEFYGSEKRRYRLPANPFDIPVMYTVPSTQWLRTGSNIKTEGSGVNLLGYVLLAIKHMALGYSEIDIHYLHNKKKYPVKPTVIRTMPEFKDMMRRLIKAKYVAIDTEATSLNKLKNTLLTIQFCLAPDVRKGQNLFVLPMMHKETPWNAEELEYITTSLRWYFTHKTKNRMHIYHAGKYDLIQFINQLNIQWFATPIYDTMAGVFSLDENTKFLKAIGVKGYSLEYIEPRYGFTRPPELVIGKEDRGNMAAFTLDEIAEYGSYDVLSIYHAALLQIRAAKKRGYVGFAKIVTHQIGIMQLIFAFMEARGILVDKKYLQQLASPIGPLADRIKETVQEFYSLKSVKKANRRLLHNRKNVESGSGLFDVADPFIFDIGNNESLQTLFFDVLGLEPLRRTADGGGSVDKKFQKEYKDVKAVALYALRNKLAKLKSAFADSILKTLNESADAREDGRIRNSYWFITVLTGRSSATDPNMQQIPSRGEDAKMIKLQFIAAFGKIFVKSDFSAHEIRVTGIVSGDKIIKKTFEIANEAVRALRVAGHNALEDARAGYKKNGDIHILNVRFFYNKEVDSDHPLRTDVKVTVFQTIYGSLAKSLGRQIGKSTEEAQKLMDKLFETWSGAKKFMDDTVERGSKRLRVFSPINRPRHLWAYLHPDKWVGYAMNRRGPNSIMQGFAADIVHQSGYCLQEETYQTFIKPGLKFDGQLLLMVHDSMTNEVMFKFAPVMMYLVEHAKTTLVMQRLKKVFGLDIEIPFGFDMGMGLSEGSIEKWKEMRLESAEEIFRNIAKNGDESHREQLPDALHNLRAIWKVRRQELMDDPYTMTLQGDTQWYIDNIRGISK